MSRYYIFIPCLALASLISANCCSQVMAQLPKSNKPEDKLQFDYVTFSRIFGGSQNDWVKYGIQSSDGGFIVTGETESFGAGMLDIFLCKIDGYGNIMWVKTYGGLNEDRVSFIQQINNSGYLLVGYSYSFVSLSPCGGFPCSDLYLIRTDMNGDTLWTRTYGHNDPLFEGSVWSLITEDEGFIIAGSNGHGSILLLKTDSGGNTLWSRQYNIGVASGASEIKQTSDSGYVIVGTSQSAVNPPEFNACLIRTDKDGNILWANTYGGVNFDEGTSVIEVSDGGFVVLGQTRSFGAGLNDIFLIKTDANGDVLWAKSYGTQYEDWAGRLLQTSDGNFIITLLSVFPSLVKTTDSGEIIWSKGYRQNQLYLRGSSAQQTTDGGYFITGDVSGGLSQGVHILKTDTSGNIGCQMDTAITVTVGNPVFTTVPGGTFSNDTIESNQTSTIVGDISPSDSILCYTCTPPTAGFSFADSLLSVSFTDASSYSTGWSWDFGDGNTDTVQNPGHTYAGEGTYEVCLIASNICGSDTVCDSVIVTSVGIGNAENQQVFVHAYPNPFSNKTTIAFSVPESSRVKLNVFNISGGLVATLFDEDAESGKIYNLEFNSTGLPGGVYFYNLFTDEGTYTNKLVIIKQ